jgi:hypothetical protein
MDRAATVAMLRAVHDVLLVGKVELRAAQGDGGVGGALGTPHASPNQFDHIVPPVLAG